MLLLALALGELVSLTSASMRCARTHSLLPVAVTMIMIVMLGGSCVRGQGYTH